MLVIALTFPSSLQIKEIATAATVINEEMSAIEQFVTVSNLLHNFLQISSALRENCPYFPGFGPNTERYFISVQMWGNTDQNNSEYRHFLCSAVFTDFLILLELFYN